MAPTNRGPLAGTATLSIDSENWNIVGDAQYQPSGDVNETLKGQTAVEGFSTMPQEGWIEATVRMRADYAASKLQGMSGVTVTLVMATGVMVTATDAWQVGQVTVNTQEGTMSVRFESDTVVEDTVS